MDTDPLIAELENELGGDDDDEGNDEFSPSDEEVARLLEEDLEGGDDDDNDDSDMEDAELDVDNGTCCFRRRKCRLPCTIEAL